MSTSKVLGFLFCLASFTLAVSQGNAEIEVGALQSFNTLPTTNEWTTASRVVTGGTGSGDFIDAGALEADLLPIATVAAIRFSLGSDPGNPPGTAGIARWSSVGLNITTRPTGVSYLVLLAKITNNTASDLPSVVVSYDLSGTESSTEDNGLAGHLVYYSVTGLANSWTPLPDISGGTLGQKLATIDLGSWPPGSHLYLLWVDDNAVANPDGIYTIDNFLVSTGVNPPVINVQPHSTNVLEGRTIALEVKADGAGLTYSWQKAGGAIDPANPTINQAVLIITNAAFSDAGDYFCVVANAAGSDTSLNATVNVEQDLVPPKFVSAAEDPFDLTVVNLKMDEALCQGAAITPNCTKESWQPFLWHVREKNNPSAELGVVGVTINGTDVALQTGSGRTIGVRYVVAVELGVGDLYDNEMPEGTQVDVQPSGAGFKQNAGGYLGTQDTFITSDAPDTTQSAVAYIESDQVNPQNGISQGLLRFDNIFGDTPGQVPPGASIESATLILNHTIAGAEGSPVDLYRMLIDWDQNTATWNSFVDGIQPDDLEAAAVPELQIISPSPAPFILNLDVTESVRTWASGVPNYGWVFINTAGDGYRPDSSDSADPPGLIIKYSTGTVVALSITLQGANAQIGWGAEAAGYTLESTPSLGGATAANWTAVAGAPNPLTAAGTVTSPRSSGPKFYRLRK